mmetsp:Transcript_15465/g.26570  ORF Transcript_15465/g.26570 Transcript_15465/m.26570 type:complete len:123 (-) Transcript_15465:1347-1715(-)
MMMGHGGDADDDGPLLRSGPWPSFALGAHYRPERTIHFGAGNQAAVPDAMYTPGAASFEAAFCSKLCCCSDWATGGAGGTCNSSGCADVGAVKVCAPAIAKPCVGCIITCCGRVVLCSETCV